MQIDLDVIILENLIYNEDYSRKVIPFIKPEYFQDTSKRVIYEQVLGFASKYNSLPSQDELVIELSNQKGLSQSDFDGAVDIVNELTKKIQAPSFDWLISKTESFCKERSIYNAVLKAAERLDDLDEYGNVNLGNIPDDIQNALSITFDSSVGLDYSDMGDRWERRKQRKVDKVPFCVDELNKASNGGMNLKTVTCIAAGTGAGKSAVMCAQAAHSMLTGVDTLYITLEMDEDAITDRIDANVLGIDLDDVLLMSKESYETKLSKKLDGQKLGRLVVKEYPTACAGVLEFRSLMNELKLKKNFIPKLIIVDYLNICSSSRFSAGAVNSYTLVKAIAEELRGFAKEFNAAVMTATQLNRDGVDNTNVSLKEISESSGLSHTVDMLFALMRTEELDALNQVMIKQLKNRFGDMVKMLRFVMGVDRAKFRYFSVDNSSYSDNQKADQPIEPAPDEWNGNFGVRKKKSFSGLNTG